MISLQIVACPHRCAPFLIRCLELIAGGCAWSVIYLKSSLTTSTNRLKDTLFRPIQETCGVQKGVRGPSCLWWVLIESTEQEENKRSFSARLTQAIVRQKARLSRAIMEHYHGTVGLAYFLSS